MVEAEVRSSVGSEAAQMVMALLQLDPTARPSAAQALYAPFVEAQTEALCSRLGEFSCT